MNRHQRVEVFNSTIRKISTDKGLKESLIYSIKEQKVIKDFIPLDSLPSPNKAGIIRLSRDRSFQAASRHIDKHVATLNFASWTNPGGGVESGSAAQEESLCRISTLFPALNDERMMKEFYYPHRASSLKGIYNDDVIYTPDVTIFREDDDNMNFLTPDKWTRSDVITCAAPNLLAIKSLELIGLESIFRNRFSKVLSISYQNNASCVVLGAFGCGVFGNDPHLVAKATVDVLSKFRAYFDIIEVPVFCGADTSNYDAFEKVFSAFDIL